MYIAFIDKAANGATVFVGIEPPGVRIIRSDGTSRFTNALQDPVMQELLRALHCCVTEHAQFLTNPRCEAKNCQRITLDAILDDGTAFEIRTCRADAPKSVVTLRKLLIRIYHNVLRAPHTQEGV